MKEYSRYVSINQEKQQKINRALVINLLRQEKLCSRADLANLSGLKRATITNIINEFMEYDLVVEDGILDGSRGRRSIGIRVNGQKYRTIGVMITRQYYSIGMMGISGEVYTTQTYQIEKGRNPDRVIEEMKNNIREMIESAQDSRILAMGIAVPGPYERCGDKMVFATNLAGWDGIEIAMHMKKDFDIPVFVENDANAGVCAQLWFHEGRLSQQNIAYVVAGQGIGCGIILNGELQKGSIGIAGEIGHTSINYQGPQCECGNRGCLEKYCSSIAVMNSIRERLEKGEASVLGMNAKFQDFAEAVRQGDAVAQDEYRKACEFLAMGIVNMINQINPSEVIIGDILTEVEPELLLKIVRHKVKEIVRPMVWEHLKIELSHLEHNPIMIGAGVIAAQEVFENPISYMKKA